MPGFSNVTGAQQDVNASPSDVVVRGGPNKRRDNAMDFEINVPGVMIYSVLGIKEYTVSDTGNILTLFSETGEEIAFEPKVIKIVYGEKTSSDGLRSNILVKAPNGINTVELTSKIKDLGIPIKGIGALEGEAGGNRRKTRLRKTKRRRTLRKQK